MPGGHKMAFVAGLLVLVLGAVLLTFSCCLAPRRLPEVPALPTAPPTVVASETVRILLDRSQTEIEVATPGGGTLYGLMDDLEYALIVGEGPWHIGEVQGRVSINGEPQPESALSLRPDGEVFRIGERTYRGRLALRAMDDGRLSVVNIVEPEDYLRGVLPSEMYPRWPLNALMAQAVAARSYLYYTVAQRGYLNLVDMAYRGAGAETRDTDLAVELTRGVIMTYNGELFSAYFHSTCGGHTASVAKVFNEEPIGPLTGVPCTWCRPSHHYDWRVHMDASELSEALSEWGVMNGVTSVEPLGKGVDGYARQVLVNGSVRIPANAFRLAVGGSRLKSVRFTVTSSEGGFTFTGQGYGHGVGLCQWGAFGQAKAGHGWLEILRHYYPGAALQEVAPGVPLRLPPQADEPGVP